MDELSAEMFARPSVKVVGFEENQVLIEAACQEIFGRKFAPEEIAELIAAPDEAEVEISVHDEDLLELHLGYKWFNGTHDYIFYREGDTRVVEFEEIQVAEVAPSALEVRLFAKQVRAFRQFGLNEIRLWAKGHGGDPYWRGYYVWARYGFRMFIRGTEVVGTPYEGVEDTLELFERFEDSGAADWWRENGSERVAVFYLEENSDCCLALDSYLEQKGVNVHG